MQSIMNNKTAELINKPNTESKQTNKLDNMGVKAHIYEIIKNET
jgi:hypothetical protein